LLEISTFRVVLGRRQLWPRLAHWKIEMEEAIIATNALAIAVGGIVVAKPS
jgi:hypothetical protein